MEYDDFVIQLVPKGGREFWDTVLGSAAGDNDGIFRLPLEPKEIQSLRALMRQVGRDGTLNTKDVPTRDIRLLPLSGNPVLNLQQVGGQLFQALFKDGIRSLFDRSLGSMQKGRGVRINIHLDPDNADLLCLCNLPWEILFWKDGREFLSLSRNSPIVRSLVTPRPSQPLRLDPPLRILVVISNPPGETPIGVERERSLIENAWGSLKETVVQFSENQPLTVLRDNLLNGDFNIVHYIGHGSFDANSGEGGLVLVDENGLTTTAPGPSIANALRNLPSLRLVFLNACNTAETPLNAESDAFTGVAAALVKAGIPAVLAMQFPISDRAAIAFSETFYERLADGDPPEAATVEGRLAIYFLNPNSLEWITPVLFTRTPNLNAAVAISNGLKATEAPLNTKSTLKDFEIGEKTVQCFKYLINVAGEITEDLDEAG